MTRRPLLRSAVLAAATAVAAVATALPTVPAGAVAPPTAATALPAAGSPWVETPTGSEEQFRGVSALSRTTAWVSGTGGTVLRTTDGGRTWSDVSPGGGTGELQFRDVEAFDARTAVVLSIGEGTASRIYRTQDGGRTWRRSFLNRDAAAFYDCMAFWDRGHGIALSDPVDGRFRILRTSNGGRSWEVVSPRGMVPALDGEFAFAASGTCLVAAGSRHAWIATGGGERARVLSTHDRGTTWTAEPTPVASADAGGIFSLAARGRYRLVAVGGDFTAPEVGTDAVARSTSGGRTWSAGGPLGGYRSGAAWIPRVPGGVVAVGPSGTDISLDGGRTWRTVERGNLDAVDCAPSACWASGAEGRVAVLRRHGG